MFLSDEFNQTKYIISPFFWWEFDISIAILTSLKFEVETCNKIFPPSHVVLKRVCCHTCRGWMWTQCSNLNIAKDTMDPSCWVLWLYSTPLVQSRSFNKLWNLGQTSASYCLTKASNTWKNLDNSLEKSMYKFWQVHVATWRNRCINLVTNPCNKSEKSTHFWHIHLITQRS